MVTCNDCIHKELCDVYSRAGVTDIPADDISICELFKNKADVVEVVRCKECLFRHVPCQCALWYGTNNNAEYFIERGDNFYCGYGKRKGAENG